MTDKPLYPVSGNSRPEPQDRRMPRRPAARKEVGLARISYPEPFTALCSCSWTMTHVRSKVLEDGVDRHVDKKHEGRAIRL
jgi:hypothetical protein